MSVVLESQIGDSSTGNVPAWHSWQLVHWSAHLIGQTPLRHALRLETHHTPKRSSLCNNCLASTPHTPLASTMGSSQQLLHELAILHLKRRPLRKNNPTPQVCTHPYGPRLCQLAIHPGPSAAAATSCALLYKGRLLPQRPYCTASPCMHHHSIRACLSQQLVVQE